MMPSIWAEMDYVPPRGSCNYKAGIMAPRCACLRFMIHPTKLASSFSCDGCAHHASFHDLENKQEGEIVARWRREEVESQKKQSASEIDQHTVRSQELNERDKRLTYREQQISDRETRLIDQERLSQQNHQGQTMRLENGTTTSQGQLPHKSRGRLLLLTSDSSLQDVPISTQLTNGQGEEIGKTACFTSSCTVSQECISMCPKRGNQSLPRPPYDDNEDDEVLEIISMPSTSPGIGGMHSSFVSESIRGSTKKGKLPPPKKKNQVMAQPSSSKAETQKETGPTKRRPRRRSSSVDSDYVVDVSATELPAVPRNRRKRKASSNITSYAIPPLQAHYSGSNGDVAVGKGG